MVEAVGSDVGLHLHETRGTALVCAYAALQLGVTRFDTSVGGLGGSPFAAGAAGNLATEELVAMLDDLGVETDIDVEALVVCGGPGGGPGGPAGPQSCGLGRAPYAPGGGWLMPHCDTCERFYNPNTLEDDGSCPACGQPVGDAAEVATAPGAAPWHFKLLVACTVAYLGWRLRPGAPLGGRTTVIGGSSN